MLKKYRNGFLEIIDKNNLAPIQFDAIEEIIDDRECFIISLKDTPLKFIVRGSSLSHHKFEYSYVQFVPNYTQTEYMPKHTWEDIGSIYAKFDEWLKDHITVYMDDLLTPDLWEQIKLQKPLMSTSEFIEHDTSHFSEEEKSQLRLSLSEFKLLIAENFKPTKEQMRIIDDRLNYVSDALDRLNKFDWKSILISTALSISVALSLDTARGKLLFDLLKKVLSNVIYLLN